MREFAKPGPEHQRLKRLTGVFAARIKHFAAPDASPQESSGEFLARMDIGGYFLVRAMNFGMQGYQGHGIIGWDPFAKRYVGTWIDSTSPIIYRTDGQFDERGRFCETSSGADPDGIQRQVRLTTEIVDQNQMLFRMFHLGDDGKEWLVLEIEHTRRKFV